MTTDIKKATAEIRERTNGIHIDITTSSGMSYRLTVQDNFEEIELMANDGKLIVRPQTANLIKLSTIE